ncbi:MAG: hypothetical protein RLZZ366_1778 [Pseudomonadota bacterium]|jgi:hypothetical protein
MASAPDLELNTLEQIAKIRQLLTDTSRKQQEYRFAPWQMAIGGLTAGAAIFAAGAAFSKLFF